MKIREKSLVTFDESLELEINDYPFATDFSARADLQSVRY
jgi:hypothetical protein